ncbi:MAG: F0F1 ATP synthase subunit alpha, partial [Candidatus Pacebacteria bacterium]|nr:F0F1 ATP synthase subunit alpha [Candidatus Paceibacterota bacterium]
LDGRPLQGDTQHSLFPEAPGVLERVPITRPLETGILSIDSTIPIGKGQRELIIGDRMTGKTTICVDSILNQKGKDVVCIYCCIGRSYSSLRRVVETLKLNGALDYTVVVSATASTCTGEQYLAPYTAAAIGEYFMRKGGDVFVVFDDLTKHAWAYRELSLLMERPPGRECYPGDIFYLHSQLMERAAQLMPELGGGSMTFFPIVDTLQGDVTGFIPSNLVSMTDGQIYMNTTLFTSGFRPAIDLGLSVSRIGNKVQSHALRQLSAMLRLEYVQYNELLKKTRFTAGVSEEIENRLRPGEVLTRLFTQDPSNPYSAVKELLLLYAMRRKILEPLEKSQIERFKNEIEEYARKDIPSAIETLNRERELTPELRKTLNACMGKFIESITG